MLCTLQTYKHDHITVPKCAENWKVQQSVPRYTGSIEQNKVLHSQWFHLKFRVFFAFIILEIGTGHTKKWYENFLHVHRRNVVKEKKNCMV